VTGWLEVELDGGALVHVEGRPWPVEVEANAVAGLDPPSWDGRAVQLEGAWRAPWHPRGRPRFAVEAIAPWVAAGVEAPGTPPLLRIWRGARLAGRAALRRRIAERFPEHAGLVAALLIADRSALPADVRERFTRAGTAHLLAISGFHVGVLAGWVLLLLGGLSVPRPIRPAVAVGATWGYVAMLGLPTSAVRAAAIVSVFALGRLRGRPVHPLGAWATALGVVAWLDPRALASAGPQLSFAGSLGLLLWARGWSRRLGGERPEPGASRRRRIGHAVAVAVAVSAAAQVATAPLVAWHFQRIPLAGLPASVLATPLVAAALPGAILALVAPAAWLAAPFAAGARGLMEATLGVVDLLAVGSGTVWAGPPLLAALGAGGTLGAWVAGAAEGRRSGGRGPVARTLHASGARRRAAKRRGAVVGGWCGLLLLPLASGVLPRPLEIHLIDIGQGDAILVRSPRGAWTLIDTGPGPGEDLLRGLARRGVRRLETLVVTHPDLDHLGAAAAVLRTVEVGAILGPGMLRGTEAVSELVAAARAERVPWRVASAGEEWRVDGSEWRILHAGGSGLPPNDRSIVIHLRYGSFDALLTGDVSSSVEDGLPARLAPGTTIEVLKVAHHGSTTSTSEALLDALRPRVALVSAGRGNRFGHPSPVVVRRIARRGIPLLRTDQGGDLVVRGRRDGSFTAEGRYAAGGSD
jgi:competence protein ComEC